MSKQSPTIMIIEDEELLLEAISKKLGFSKIATISCTSGKQALEYLSSLENLPDAIWLDYYLEDMNGIDFMKKIKERREWKNIPVIVVSNSASEQKVHSMLALGAKKYLVKAEHKLDDIVESIKEFIVANNNKKTV